MQGKVLPERSAIRVYVGVDVCKAWLDCHLHPLGRSLRVANSRDGLQRLMREPSGLAVALVVMEATAKHHRQAHRTLHAAGFAVAVVNPLRSRLFAEAIGMLAKTEPVDARLLAILGESLAPQAQPPAPENLEEFRNCWPPGTPPPKRRLRWSTGAAPARPPFSERNCGGGSPACKRTSPASRPRSSGASTAIPAWHAATPSCCPFPASAQ